MTTEERKNKIAALAISVVYNMSNMEKDTIYRLRTKIEILENFNNDVNFGMTDELFDAYVSDIELDISNSIKVKRISKVVKTTLAITAVLGICALAIASSKK